MANDWINHLPLEDVRQVTQVGGGDVNQAYRIDTGKENHFLLVQPNHPQSFYASEIAGLGVFKEAGIQAPRVIVSGQINGDAYLLLNYLERGTGKQSYQDGMDLTLISQWLGHAQLDTTLIYAHADPEQKCHAIAKAPPSDSPLKKKLNSEKFTVTDEENLKLLYGLK